MKKTKILFLLSLLSVVFLFAACSKEKTVDGNVNDKSNAANQGDTSIDDNKTEENSSIEATDQQINDAEEADIICIKTSTSYDENGEITFIHIQHIDEENRIIKECRCNQNGVIIIEAEYIFLEESIEITQTQYNDDGSIKACSHSSAKRINYDNGYYTVGSVLYNSGLAEVTVYNYNENGTLIESCTYGMRPIGDKAAISFPLKELVYKDISQYQNDSYTLALKETQEYELDENGLEKSCIHTYIGKASSTETYSSQFEHVLDDYGNPIKTEIFSDNKLDKTVTYEYTYAK